MSKISRQQIVGMNMHYSRFPLERFLDDMGALDVAKIEIWAGSPHLYAEDMTPHSIAVLRREIERRGLKLSCYTPEQCIYPVNIAAREPALLARSLSYFEVSMNIAAELGSPRFLITPGWGYEGEPREEAMRRSVDSLAKLADLAGQLGLTLLLEPLQRIESNLINDAASLRDVLVRIDSQHLFPMVDSVAMAAAGQDFDDYYDVLPSAVAYVHFIDGNPTGHLPWGDGKLPLSTYIDQLADHGYQGPLSLEFASSDYWLQPDLAVKKSLAALEPYFLS